MLESKKERYIKFFAYSVFLFGWLSVNIYLPVLPQLSTIFNTSEIYVKLTVSLFLLGFSLSQLIWGSLSDRFGRKPILFLGLIATTTGAFISGLSFNIFFFSLGRFIESIGMGVGPVLIRSMLTDHFDRKQLTHTMATSAIIVAVTPMVAPVIGSYIDNWLGWRAIFFLLVIIGGLLSFTTYLHLWETNRKKLLTLDLSGFFKTMTTLLSHRKFVGYLLIYGMAFGGLMSYYTVAPFLYIINIHLNKATYSYLLIANVIGYMGGAFVARRLSHRVHPDPMIFISLCIMIAAGISYCILAFLDLFNILAILLPMVFYALGTGMISPNCNTGALTVFKENAGVAAALTGFGPSLWGAILSAILSAFRMNTLIPISIFFITLSLVLLFVFIVFLKLKSHDQKANT